MSISNFLILGILVTFAIEGSEVSSPIATAVEVRRLGPEQARKEYPVQISGVVTWVNVSSGELFVQDATAGIFVFVRNSDADGLLRAGQTVMVSGVTAAGDFSSSITKARIHITGQGQMPKSVSHTVEQFITGELDSQWGHLEGLIRSGREDGGVLYMNAVSPDGKFLAILKDYPRDWPTSLVDSKVSFDGVFAAIFNEQRQASGLRIFVSGLRFLRIEDPAPSSPFALPQSSADSVGSFHADHGWTHRIRVRATLTAIVSKTLIYVSDGAGNLAIELGEPYLGKPGSVADFVGFPGSVDGRPGLQNAVFRLISSHKEARPVELLASDVLPSQTIDEGSGLAIAKGTRNDLKLITLSGTLVQVSRGVHSETLTLVSSGDQLFGVTLPDSVASPLKTFEPGTQMKVTGVCLITLDEYRKAQSFRLLARDPTDIVITSRSPWLTIRRALWIMVPMLMLVVASLTWVSVLRRHVASKTKQLSSANELLQKAATEDALTGAANRRRFNEVLNIEAQCSDRTSSPLSLVMIDIDYFKNVNDLYGHQQGDQCLIEVVRVLRRVVSPSTGMVVARYGGEEFAVVMPHTSQEAALAVAEQMRTGVIELAIRNQRSPFNQHLTISAGVATLSAGSPGPAEFLVSCADRALYQAKQAGRNRVFGSEKSSQQTDWTLNSSWDAAESQLPLSTLPPRNLPQLIQTPLRENEIRGANAAA